MRVLVTGGAGFIGTNFVAQALKAGYSVRILDALTYAGGRENIAAFGPQITFIHGTVCDPAVVNEALQDAEIVVHFAAESHNTRSEMDPDIFYRTNVTGVETLLTAAGRSPTLKRFLHISTDEVYGSINQGFFRETDKEPGDHQATSAYAKSKAQADDRACAAGRQGLPIIVLRPTNNFGPWQYPEKALPRWITNLLAERPIPLWGEGRQVRDWLFVEQTAAAVLFLIEHGLPGEAYNLAANHQPEVTNRAAAELVCRILKKNPDQWIEHIPDPRPQHDFRYALDTTKLRELGWSPTIDLAAQFRATIDWYQTHPAWWQARKAAAEAIYKP